MKDSLYTYCTILLVVDILIFWVSALLLKKRKRTSRSFSFERAKTGFFLSQILLCISFVSLSYLLTSPYCFQSDVLASKENSSNLILKMLVRDTKAVLNVVHALVTFGLTVHLYLQPQIFLTDVSRTVALYLFVTSTVSLGLQAIHLSSFGSPLHFIIALIQTLVCLFAWRMSTFYSYEQEKYIQKHKKDIGNANQLNEEYQVGNMHEYIEETTEYKFSFLGNKEFGQTINDPYTLKQSNTSMFWMGIEMKLFIVYNIVIFGFRAKSAFENEVDFTVFIEGCVQANSSSIYQALVVAFGYYGSKFMIAAPLGYYSFANSVLALISLLSIVPVYVFSSSDIYFIFSLVNIFSILVSKYNMK